MDEDVDNSPEFLKDLLVINSLEIASHGWIRGEDSFLSVKTIAHNSLKLFTQVNIRLNGAKGEFFDIALEALDELASLTYEGFKEKITEGMNYERKTNTRTED